jgi:hypothetical protein
MFPFFVLLVSLPLKQRRFGVKLAFRWPVERVDPDRKNAPNRYRTSSCSADA